LAEQWQSSQIRNLKAKKRRAHAVGQLVQFLRARGTRVMLVKGAALDAAVYAQPWYVRSDDVDMIVDRPWADFAPADHRALNQFLDGKHIELDFMRPHDLDMNEVLHIDYARVWLDARPVELACGRVYLMSREDMLLTACINLCRKRYVQLKGMVGI